MAVLQFVPFNSSIDPTFWHALTKLKIDVLKLADEPIPILGWYERGRWVNDRDRTGTEIGIGGEFRVDGKSFETDPASDRDRDRQIVPGRVPLRGWLKNFNTIEDFKASDKQALFNSFADQLWQDLTQKSPPDHPPAHFLVITFADLKKYRFCYWFAFPAFAPKPSWMTVPSGSQEGWRSLALADAVKLAGLLATSTEQHWIAKQAGQSWVVGPVSDWPTFFEKVSEENVCILVVAILFIRPSSRANRTPIPDQRYLVFIDPAAHPQAVGWPLRNLLATLSSCWGDDARKFNVIAYRDPLGSNQPIAVSRSLVVMIELPAQVSKGRPTALGWEKNAAGKLAPRMADLAPMMDPSRLADQAVDLNLKLMRWRILPDLDLEKISATKCLLLGAGTLGCYVGRTLLAWGVRKITFVDSAKVSFSNPVRQPLFEFNDCLEGGKPKAACAAASLKRIFPGVDAEGVALSIPMPGHPIAENLIGQTKEDVRRLEELFDAHDVIYLLMDSRESRWLPTVLGACKRKLVMNVALGFDSYLVMRHGVRPGRPLAPVTSSSTSLAPIRQLGCYFCNDVVVPSDSLTDRTLDQMCTVTRPGLAPIASATAVEIMAAVLQHPEGIEALAEVKDPLKPSPADEKSVLGTVPHQIRGFLSRFENMKLVGPAYEKCTGCSEVVIKEYESRGHSMMIQVFNEQKYLERLTGLDKLYDEGEAAMERVDWDEEDEDGF